MKLSLKEKRDFYHELGRMIRAGRAFPSALEFMLENTRGKLSRFLRALQSAALRGDSVADALASQRPAVSEMELGILTASERAGRLDRACGQLSTYFGALEQARATVFKRMAYPFFVLHLGVFSTAAGGLAMGGTWAGFLRQTVGFLLLLYGAVFLLAWLAQRLMQAAESNAAIDGALRAVPLFGKVRRAFALARFTATYEAQLAAGVNVLDALTEAARASRSALVLDTVRAALPSIRTGAKVGPLLENARVFPPAVGRAFRLAEETGELDEELQRLTEELEREALSRVEVVSDWVPKILYFLIVLYLGYQIVAAYSNMAASYEKVLDF